MMRRPAFCRPARRMHGFTLVELMVAVALGLLLLSALSALVVATVSNNAELDKTARRIENSRYALQVMRDDVELAGFVGASGNVWTYGGPIAVCLTGQTNYGYEDASGRAPTPVQIISAAEMAAALPACLADEHVKSGTPALLVTRVSTAAVAPNGAVPSAAYVQVSNCKDDTDRKMVFALGSAGAAAFPLRTLECNDGKPEVLREAIRRLYFISDCNRCGNDEIPTLKVLDVVGPPRGGAQPQATALAEGIEDLQLAARFEGSQDGTNNGVYIEKPNTLAGWGNAVAMTITVTARDTEKSTSAAGRDYRRQTDSMTVRLNNAPGNLAGAPAANAGASTTAAD